jgi:hypothetical protein
MLSQKIEAFLFSNGRFIVCIHVAGKTIAMIVLSKQNTMRQKRCDFFIETDHGLYIKTSIFI